jgi:dipeptidyl aminopeptidase/acylaminoacyl peptidase
MRPFPGGTLQSVYPVQIDYSRASGELIYGDFSARLQLWSFELAEKSGLPRWRPWISSSSSEMLPDWSPDGRWVSFGGDRQGVEQLWIVNAEGGEQRQRTQYPLFPSIGSWSPDSRFFAVADVQPGFRTGLVHRVDVLNGGLQVLNPLVQAFYVVYRPNGNLLALDGKSIIELHGDGTVCATLDIPALFLRASGNHIYLVKDRVKGEIWRYSPDQERKLELIVKDLSPPHHTFWTLGKRNLYYVAAPGGDRLMLRALDLASREVKDLGPVPGPPPAPFGAGLAVNPEETRLIVTLSAPGNGDLFRLALGKPE